MRSNLILGLLCALAAAPAHAQTVVSPQTGMQNLGGAAGAALSPGAPLALPGSQLPLLSVSIAPALPTVVVPNVRRIAAQTPRTKLGAEMASFKKIVAESRRDERGEGAEKGLRAAFDGGVRSAEPASIVDAAEGAGYSLSSRPSLSARQASAPESPHVPAPGKLSGDPEGGRGSRLRSIARALGSVLSAGIGLYGGWKIGDVAYSLFLHRFPLAGGVLAALILPLAAYWARRSKTGGAPQRPVIPFLIGSFAANALGNLLWTLTGSAAAGLGLGLALGLALGLYSAGAAGAGRPSGG